MSPGRPRGWLSSERGAHARETVPKEPPAPTMETAPAGSSRGLGKLPCGEGPSCLRLLVTRERCASCTGPFSSSPTCAQPLAHLLTPARTGPGAEAPGRKACAPQTLRPVVRGPSRQARLRGHLAAFILFAPSSPALLFAFEEAGCTTQGPQGREHGKARRDGTRWPGSPAGPGQNSWVSGQGRFRRHQGSRQTQGLWKG